MGIDPDDSTRASARASSILLAAMLLSHCGGTSHSRSSGGAAGGTAATGGGAGGIGTTSGAGGSSGRGAGGESTRGGAGGSAGEHGGGTGGTGTSGTTSTAGRADGGSAGAGTAGEASAGGEGGASEPEPPAPEPPSCEGFDGDECAGHDCCESPIVPGGAVTLGQADVDLPSFRLDRFEVTVARFRKFMLAQKAWALAGNPAEGAGAHPLVPGSGWKPAWLGKLDSWIVEGIEPKWLGFSGMPEGPEAPSLLGGNPTYPIAGTDRLAVNFVPMHVAFAFCIWDGGRLPAAVEWQYAFERGDQHTRYPWGDHPTPAEVFADRPEASVPTPYATDSAWGDIGITVGSHPASAGRFGQDDLAAGFGELLRDTLPIPSDDPSVGLIGLVNDDELESFTRAFAPASWLYPGAATIAGGTGIGSSTVGFRCARDLPR